jgi:hypothetical protein
MSFDLVFSYPKWYLLLCLILAAIYAGGLYYKNEFLDQGKKNFWVYPMAAFRLIAVFLLAVLLLNPMLKYIRNIVEKPVVLLVQDNSGSIVKTKDSLYYKKEYAEGVSKLESELSKKFEVHNLLIGKSVKMSDNAPDYSDGNTDISALFRFVDDNFEGRNVGAVVLASDGIFNKGSNPAFSSFKQKIPLYTISLGDSSVYKDVSVSSVKYNNVVFLGDEYPMRIGVNGAKCVGENSLISIYEDDKLLKSKTVDFTEEDDYKEWDLFLDATKPGTHHLKVTASEVDGERSVLNNVKDIYFEVLDSRKKVVLVYKSPHPDIGAIQRSLVGKENYTFVKARLDGQVDINDADLVILYDIPERSMASIDLLEKIKSDVIPCWVIVGLNTELQALNNLGFGAALRTNGEFSDVQSYVNSSFNLFTVEPEITSSMSDWPPLTVPYGAFNLAPNSQVIFKQKIGSIESSKPLFVLSKNVETNYGILYGTGIWKWRMADYASNKNFDVFDGMMGKVIQFLSTQEDRRKFQIQMDKQVFQEDENVRFRAVVYNANYESVSDKEVRMKVSSKSGKEYDFNFSKTGSTYQLDAGLLPEGEYEYSAKVLGPGYVFAGKFSVKPVQEEYNDLSADFSLMRELARNNGGENYTKENINLLKDDLINSSDIKNVFHSEKNLEDLINLKWLFFLFLTLLGAEWFMRKREGSY